MVINIDDKLLTTIFWVILGLFAFKPVMENIVIPLLEWGGKYIKNAWNHSVSFGKRIHNLRWYYKIIVFILGFVVFGWLSGEYSEFWIYILVGWFFLCVFYFSRWCVDMCHKLYVGVTEKLKH